MPGELKPLTLKPGEFNLSCPHNKFYQWNDTYNYYQQPTRSISPFKTEKLLSSQYNLSNYRKSYGIVTTLRGKCRSQVIREPMSQTINPGDRSRNRLMKSTSQLSFRGTGIWEHLSHFGAEDYRPHFDSLSIPPTEPNSDADIEVLIKDIPRVVRLTLGDEVPDAAVDKFVKLAAKLSNSDRISWAQFSDVIPTVTDAILSDCQLRKEYPALLKLMMKPPTCDKNLLHLEMLTTTYRDTHCKGLARSQSAPAHVSIVEAGTVAKFAHKASDASLIAGTTKATHQIPGYAGHIPANMRIPRKKEHAMGDTLHAVENHLSLTQEGMGSLTGYTGFIPRYTAAGVERTTSCDPRTTNGFFFGTAGRKL